MSRVLWLNHRNDWALNAELPVLSPWKMVTPINSPIVAMERNAYSIWVDTAGNQLPYIDRVSHVFSSRPEIVVLKAVAGVLDFQDRHLEIARLPVLLSNRKRSGYDVFLDPFAGSDFAVGMNIGYKEDAEIGSLLRATGFRRALSLGLDRDAFNETFMLGLARRPPRCLCPTTSISQAPNGCASGLRTMCPRRTVCSTAAASRGATRQAIGCAPMEEAGCAWCSRRRYRTSITAPSGR